MQHSFFTCNRRVNGGFFWGGDFFFENVKSDNLNNFQFVTYTHLTPLVFIVHVLMSHFESYR